jgi:hypothetical protein
MQFILLKGVRRSERPRGPRPEAPAAAEAAGVAVGQAVAERADEGPGVPHHHLSAGSVKVTGLAQNIQVGPIF